MAETRFDITHFDSGRDRTRFSCGVAELDQYFHQRAGQDARRGAAAIYLLIDREHDRIAGFFSLSATSIEYAELSPSEIRKVPRYRLLPACLIGRLAVDTDYQGMGVGRLLIVAAMRRAWELRQEVGILAVVVDAIDHKAAAFYQQFGFAFLGEPADLRLYQLLSSARETFWPESTRSG